jgi:hypothetical protein
MSDIYDIMDPTNPMGKSMKATMKKITDLRTIKRRNFEKRVKECLKSE